jgi:hypothetical protein
VKHQAALLRRRLGGHKPHVGSGDSLTDGFCVSHVILLTLDGNFSLTVGSAAISASRRHWAAFSRKDF